MKVNYVSACLDASGYAEAARNNIAALDKVGVPLDVTPLTFEKFKSDLGHLGNLVKSKVNHNSSAKIQIVHTTATLFNKLRRSDRYNIGYTTWETTKLPPGWTDACNQMDEIWVPSTDNVKIFRDSGVTVPIYCIPHTFNRKLFEEETVNLTFTAKSDDEYAFYSVFQWTERKNPIALLKAYLTEFKAQEKVCLILKTYVSDPTADADKTKIKAMIAAIKEQLYLKEYPKILLVHSLLSKSQVHGLHKQGDCYLSFHRNEGFGIPIVEAMMAGKPVITTDFGGPTDFVHNPYIDGVPDGQTGYPVNYQMTPCFGMPWETYRGDMEWADIDIMHARRQMRRVFENREEAKRIGSSGQEHIDSNYSWETIGNLMKERLEQINGSINNAV